MQRILTVAFVALMLSACTTTEQANTALASRFKGQTADSFFLRFGPPVTSYDMDDGRRMFVWAEKQKNFSTPSTSTVNVIGNTAFVNTTPGSNVEVQCQVRLVVNKSGVIEEILAQSDSIGVWQMSRCNEVFGGKAS
ncbi:MAG: hypothetical protein KKB66_16015 [Alphaproteobacteria bacterium]|nr:hypothetical protein [Alphaproteobacteria bacterium]MBU0804319.1 hypothetical protein [Alphaproteobacteria bacterium]MBU0871150.1 hypothetical protein [Alphaproteobacteria bacterium]MBU1400905.1 hypothetical protein [Alphaproteobacteria bacterium]MBU1592678.1 hypothetical protein [Alphaproteobacteria bacterium]